MFTMNNSAFVRQQRCWTTDWHEIIITKFINVSLYTLLLIRLKISFACSFSGSMCNNIQRNEIQMNTWGIIIIIKAIHSGL